MAGALLLRSPRPAGGEADCGAGCLLEIMLEILLEVSPPVAPSAADAAEAVPAPRAALPAVGNPIPAPPAPMPSRAAGKSACTPRHGHRESAAERHRRLHAGKAGGAPARVGVDDLDFRLQPFLVDLEALALRLLEGPGERLSRQLVPTLGRERPGRLDVARDDPPRLEAVPLILDGGDEESEQDDERAAEARDERARLLPPAGRLFLRRLPAPVRQPCAFASTRIWLSTPRTPGTSRASISAFLRSASWATFP